MLDYIQGPLVKDELNGYRVHLCSNDNGQLLSKMGGAGRDLGEGSGGGPKLPVRISRRGRPCQRLAHGRPNTADDGRGVTLAGVPRLWGVEYCFHTNRHRRWRGG